MQRLNRVGCFTKPKTVSVKPFLIVPIIGAMFADLINTGIISIFLNFL